MDKLFHWFIRCVLHVKSTTSNIIVEGETGQIPPSVYAKVNVICYLERLQSLKSNTIVKQVYHDLLRLHECGHNTWVTRACELAGKYNIKIGTGENYRTFKNNCKGVLTNCYKINWAAEVINVAKYPKIRTYCLHKSEFVLEPYLDHVHDIRYRSAISKLRASSHALEIERGRYTNPRTPVDDRLCLACGEVEDEVHFIINCSIFNATRNAFFDKVVLSYPGFRDLNDKDKYIFLMSTRNEQLLVWLGKFVHNLFLARGEYLARRTYNS